MKEKMIKILHDYALENGWSGSMYEIVRHDIENQRFKSISELEKYIAS